MLPNELEPIVGEWYRNIDMGHDFMVVVFDEDLGVVEIQHIDGDIEELEMDAWAEMELEIIEAPEDWTGPLDGIDHIDSAYDTSNLEYDDWSEPIDEFQSSE